MHVVPFEIKNYKLCKVPKKKMERSWFGWISEWRMRRLLTHFIFDVVFAFHQSFMFPLLFRFFCLETWSDLLVGIINRFLIFPCSCMDLGISCGGILTDAFWVQACTILNIQPLVSTEVALLWDCSCCQMVNDPVPSWPYSCARFCPSALQVQSGVARGVLVCAQEISEGAVEADGAEQARPVATPEEVAGHAEEDGCWKGGLCCRRHKKESQPCRRRCLLIGRLAGPRPFHCLWMLGF